jgi:acyl dehydratase
LPDKAPPTGLPFIYPMLFLREPLFDRLAGERREPRHVPIQESIAIECGKRPVPGEAMTLSGTVEAGPNALGISAQASGVTAPSHVQMKTRVRLVEPGSLRDLRPNLRMREHHGVAEHAVHTASLDAETVQAYAEISGDFNPVHFDAGVAGSFGLPGPIVHGMLLAGLMEGAAAAALGDGIRGLRLWFLAPLPIGSCVEIRFGHEDAKRNRRRLSMISGNALLAVGDVELTAP